MTDQEAFEAFVSNYARTTKGERDIAEEAWYAALTYLRSQQEPVAWMAVGGSIWGHKTSMDDIPLHHPAVRHS